ncbi:MAG TPA: ABC transporter permease [Vicinamibacterales bacterium]|jgi:putative ABC transport system permease protein
MGHVLRDLRYAVRGLRRTPGFAVVTILTLALGIGANTAIFSVVNAVVLRPLPYPHPGQLVYISSQFPALGFDQFPVSPPEFFEFEERTRAFSSVGAFVTAQANLTAPDRPRRINVAAVSADLFGTLGVPPLEGRAFAVGETRPGGPHVAILSYQLWRSAFGGEPGLVGRMVEIDGVRRQVVGIMPSGFDVADQHLDAYLPLVLDPADKQSRGSHYLYLIGRLADGQTLTTARAELETLLAGWQRSVTGLDNPPRAQRVHTPNTTTHRLRFDPLQAQVVGTAGTAVWVLQGAVLFVLLIACANLANLLLARAEARHKDVAVRLALGASRGRLLMQSLTEGCVLSLAGGAAGLLLAAGGLQALAAAYPDSLPRASGVGLDWRVLIFTLVVAMACGVVFGLAPLLHLTPTATLATLKEGGQRTTSGRHRLRRALVVVEVALAVALVSGAGLLLQTVMNLTNVDAGFRRGRLVTFLVAPPRARYQDPHLASALYQRLFDQLKALPGVQNVAAMSGLPPDRPVNANDTDIEGYTAPPEGPFENIDYYQLATPAYVETMGIPVIQGRTFERTDTTGALVAMINETTARTFYRGQNPIGRRIRPSGPDGTPWFTIIGVLKDVKQGGVDKKAGTEVYFDFDQLTRIPGFNDFAMHVVMRTSLAPTALAASVRDAVRSVDPTLPVVKLQTMDEVFDQAIGRPRLLAELLMIFAGLALLLAAIGSYGVLAYMVMERRREIGIRLALGADRASVLKMVLSQGMALAAAGVVAGLIATLAIGRTLASLLFGIAPGDPATIGLVIVLMLLVAMAACYMPARSATQVDPMIILRDE